MKLSSITALATIMSLAAATASAAETADTVAVIDNPEIIKIISRDNSKIIIVEGRRDMPGYRFRYETSVSDSAANALEDLWVFNPPFANNRPKKADKKRLSCEAGCDAYAGAVIPTAADRGFSRTGWEIGMLNLARASWRLSSIDTRLSIGIGWQFRSFNIGDGMMPVKTDGGNSLALVPIPEGYSDVKSSLKTFSIQIPLTISQKIYRAFAIEVGGVAMLNTDVRGKLKWHEGDVESSYPVKGLHQRILTLDALARIGWRDNIAFYVRYSPMSQFKPHNGPQYNSVAIGLSLGF